MIKNKKRILQELGEWKRFLLLTQDRLRQICNAADPRSGTNGNSSTGLPSRLPPPEKEDSSEPPPPPPDCEQRRSSNRERGDRSPGGGARSRNLLLQVIRSLSAAI